MHKEFLKLFVVVFDLLDDFRHLVVDVPFLSHLRAYFFGRIHDCRVVPVTELRPYFWEGHVCKLSANVHGDLSCKGYCLLPAGAC